MARMAKTALFLQKLPQYREQPPLPDPTLVPMAPVLVYQATSRASYMADTVIPYPGSGRRRDN